MPDPFDPEPSLPGWNYNWESGGTWPAGNDGWFRVLFDVRIFNRYLDALNERIVAYNAGYTPAAHLAAGDRSLAAGYPSVTSWAGLQDLALQFAGFPYVVAYSGGSDYNYSTLRDVVDVLFDVAALTATLRRKFPREITSTAAAGTDGWNARLLGTGGVATTYTHTSGAWVVASTGTQPDVLADTGIAQPGDYFGPWILNDLRDLINLLVTYSSRQTDPGDPLSPFWDSNGEDNANTDGSIFSSDVAGVPTIPPHAISSGGGSSQVRTYAYPHITGVPYAGVRNRVYYWLTLGIDDPAAGPFANYGDPVLNGQLELFDTSAATTSGDYMGPKVGSTDLSPMTSDGGYSVPDLYLFVRWDQSDGSGFVYTKYTA